MRPRAIYIWFSMVCLSFWLAPGIRAQSSNGQSGNANQSGPGQNGSGQNGQEQNGQTNQNGPVNNSVGGPVNNSVGGPVNGPDDSTRINPDGTTNRNNPNGANQNGVDNSTENPVGVGVIPIGPPCAQQTSASQQQNTCVATTNPQAPTQGEVPQDQSMNPVPIPAQFQVSQLGSSQWLQPGVHSPIHLGPIYVGSASVEFLAANNLQGTQSLPGSVGDYNYVGIIRTNINFDHVSREGRLTFQYLPEMTVVNGQVSSNLNNEALTYTFTHPLSSRWNFSVVDNFSSVDGRILFADFSLDVNSVSGNGVQNPFLATDERWVAETATSTLTYIFSARDQINVAPYFEYEHTSFSALPSNGYTYGGSINWTHMLSATKSFGLFANFAERTYSTQFSSDLYEGFGGSFSDRLSPSLVFLASIAASSGLGGTSNGWSATGDVSLRKVFRTSSIALEYYRGITTGPYLTNGYTSRADGAYEKRLFQSLRGSLGVAYESDSYSGGQIAGVYGTTQLSYRISRNFDWFAAYARRWQVDAPANVNLTIGNINFISTGFTWNLSQDYASVSPTF